MSTRVLSIPVVRGQQPEPLARREWTAVKLEGIAGWAAQSPEGELVAACSWPQLLERIAAAERDIAASRRPLQ